MEPDHSVSLCSAYRFRDVVKEVRTLKSQPDMSDQPVILQVDCYLQTFVVTDDDAGLLFDWDTSGLDNFVQIANEGNQAIVPPPWITSNPGAMTEATITNDIIAHCSERGGGRAGIVLIAPNNLNQLLLVTSRLNHIETNAFIQACAIRLQDGQHLAPTFTISDKSVLRAQPTNLEADPACRQLFF